MLDIYKRYTHTHLQKHQTGPQPHHRLPPSEEIYQHDKKKVTNVANRTHTSRVEVCLTAFCGVGG